MSIANVAVTNTLNEFRETTNEVIITLNSITGGNGSISTNTIVANTISANNLTSGRVLIAGTDGLIEDDAGLIYDKTSNEIIVDGSLIANSGIVNNALIVGTVTANNLTSGRVVLAGTSGLLQDDSGITFNTSTDELIVSGRVDAVGGLIGANVTANNLTSGRVLLAGTDGIIEDNSGLTYDGTNLTLGGELRGPSTFVIDPAAVGDNTGIVVIRGNLQVDGNTTTINSNELTVDDLNIVIANNAPDASTANGAGIIIQGANVEIFYLSANDTININKGLEVSGNVDVTGNITASFFIGDGSALTNAGAVIVDDTATAAERYILFDDITSGPATTIGVSSTKLMYIPSTGNLTATIITTDTISGNTSFSSSGQIRVPVGTTGERVTDTTGAFRFNIDINQFEGYNGTTWGTVGGGATGGSGDQVFYENEQTANNTYTITAGKNAMATGPITIANGSIITVPTGSRLVIL